MGFAAEVRRWAEKAKLNKETVIRKTVVEMHASVVIKSPVDTGRFRGNWQYRPDHFAASPLDTTDRTGGATMARAAALVASTTMSGRIHYITNHLPYGITLEYGGSKQAPNGMVRITVAEFRQKVAQIAAEVNR